MAYKHLLEKIYKLPLCPQTALTLYDYHNMV